MSSSRGGRRRGGFPGSLTRNDPMDRPPGSHAMASLALRPGQLFAFAPPWFVTFPWHCLYSSSGRRSPLFDNHWHELNLGPRTGEPIPALAGAIAPAGSRLPNDFSAGKHPPTPCGGFGMRCSASGRNGCHADDGVASSLGRSFTGCSSAMRYQPRRFPLGVPSGKRNPDLRTGGRGRCGPRY